MTDLTVAPADRRLRVPAARAETAAAGLPPQDIVAVTQLIAFVPYQIRLLAGLRALQEEAAA